MTRKLVADQYHRTLRGEMHKTSQKKQTLTITRICWQNDMFSGENKAENSWTFNEQTKQLKSISKRLAMKFMLQLLGPRTCFERKMAIICALEQRAEQSWTSLLIKSFYRARWIKSQAAHWNSKEVICSVKKMKKFKDIERRAKKIFKNTSKQIVERHFSAEIQNEIQNHQTASRAEKLGNFETWVESISIRLCTIQTDLVRPKVHLIFSSCVTRAWFIDYSMAQLGNWHTKMSKWDQFVWSANCADSLTGENAGCWTTNAEYSTSGCPSRWSRHFTHLPTCGKVQRRSCSVTNSLLRIVCYLEPMQCARYKV